MNKYYGEVAGYRSSEGKTVAVKYRGDVNNTIKSILGGIRSTCTYIGARTLKDVSKCTTFIRVSQQSNEVFGKNS
jgi:GMP reductase